MMTLYFENFMPFFCGGDKVTVEYLPLRRRFSFLFFFFFFFFYRSTGDGGPREKLPGASGL